MTPLQLTAIITATAIGYLLVSGSVWLLFSEHDREFKAEPTLAAIFWPLAIPALLGIAIFRIPSRLVAWRKRVRLPRAEVRR